ncbi:hypothetical protein METBIDRAFT_115949 [Metschnikowia bicuspidata var. bicuspidata NRRL YB-4993]|uniref:Uncharacterized protein n=1 Tax=Metschnikowia bicuspidata var. bicuspidata NRRL YB-4993 TaxID=869754 RepID=A0A1A0HJ04_9ASCO|nr:hypothetical protein METBIDRAFT_115949 [Metschnikowia bicuspidata var. bicuspidata NRRL YB-4993]OBA23995.1 hypothetical protein METBIDRAFT_115949 [Metschnikowia bicuspidata var. bicuspidata NRRL YB-4993]
MHVSGRSAAPASAPDISQPRDPRFLRRATYGACCGALPALAHGRFSEPKRRFALKPPAVTCLGPLPLGFLVPPRLAPNLANITWRPGKYARVAPSVGLSVRSISRCAGPGYFHSRSQMHWGRSPYRGCKLIAARDQGTARCVQARAHPARADALYN